MSETTVFYLVKRCGHCYHIQEKANKRCSQCGYLFIAEASEIQEADIKARLKEMQQKRGG